MEDRLALTLRTIDVIGLRPGGGFQNIPHAGEYDLRTHC